MTTSPARYETSHSESWRFGHNGHLNSHRDARDSQSPDPSSSASQSAEWSAQYTRDLVRRVAAACDGQKPTPLAQRLNLHPETVRRYLNGQRPSPEFLAALCRELGISAEWLLLGEGDMRRRGRN